MIHKTYLKKKLPFGGIQELVEIEFSGRHYLPKELVKEAFGWKEHDVTESDYYLDWPYKKVVFTDTGLRQSLYHDLGNGKSVIYFPLHDVDKRKIEDLSWLEEKILATKKYY